MMILEGVIWAAAVHLCAAFPDVNVILVSTTDQYPLKNLVPLIIKRVGKEYGNLCV